MRTFPGYMACVAMCVASLQAVDLTSSGDWTRSVTAADLKAGAGSDLTSEYESSVSATTITISDTAPGTWRVYARRADANWNNSLVLSVKRTSNGMGSGAISDGSSYVQLSSIDTEIFSGTGDRTAIGLQLKLSGMSIRVSPNTYSSSVILTVAQ